MRARLSTAGSTLLDFVLPAIYLVLIVAAFSSVALPALGLPFNAWTLGAAVALSVAAMAVDISALAVERLAWLSSHILTVAWGTLIGVFGVTCAWTFGGAIFGPQPWTNGEDRLLIATAVLFAILCLTRKRR